MMQANSPWRPVQGAALHWNDSGAPVSDTFADVYYSQDNGLEESRHVFLLGNDLPRRWRDHDLPHFCVGELGFGTGLNFLLTWQAWREHTLPRPDLHYVSIEKHPLTREDLARALAQWPVLQTLAQPLLEAYPGLLPGQHRILFDEGRVRLDLWWEDAGAVLPDMASTEQALVDAWYLDGFAPARNESMWTPALLAAVAMLSRPQASCATFTAAGQVRRTLAEVGFHVTKVPGYGRKRESLRAVYTGTAATKASDKRMPWDLPAAASARPDHVLVLGAGLAGCATAAALARRGVEVTIIEQGLVANAGSGNDQGVLYTRLSRKHSALVDFSLQAFQFAANSYGDMFRCGQLTTALDGELCGSFQQSDDTEELAALAVALHGVEALAQVLGADAANTLLGVEQPKAGLWYPRSGWLHPAAVCRALLADKRIALLENCGAVTLHRDNGQWYALADGKTIAHAPCAIAAMGTGTTALQPFQWLSLQSIRGQTTQLPSVAPFANLRAALCHEGYIAPVRGGRHCIGATFTLDVTDPAPLADDNLANITKLAAAVPAYKQALEALEPSALEGRVGFRCASPDYLPVVGPAPDFAGFLSEFAGLRKNAKRSTGLRGPYLPGLYINAAHGSRGLTSTPLAAEVLASMLCEEPLPISRDLSRALSPARFIIRDLTRNRI
ncbi:MAG: bifunctional tRNA (5-methylaminomethyl-2-thiouridine)(34)-methyltransferase MnmD/FAD-dependent 5-carboxymethylaminomethyl-2-thiouridine(34) oxidoreductase MnmC [Halioglobus sp.]